MSLNLRISKSKTRCLVEGKVCIKCCSGSVRAEKLKEKIPEELSLESTDGV